MRVGPLGHYLLTAALLAAAAAVFHHSLVDEPSVDVESEPPAK